MEPRLLVGREVWQTIRRLNKSRSSPATVVVAFFGKGGAELLPLRPGDAIWVAATKQNVAAGLVNPCELLKYPDGVRVFRVAALHAKLYCFGKRVVVASANVSRNSCEVWIEAGVELALPRQAIEAMLVLAGHLRKRLVEILDRRQNDLGRKRK